MLKSLHVRNLAVLAGGELELGRGFNVLTGETGAGKSLVVDSLALLAGARAASDLVREGAETCTVAGVFDPAAEVLGPLRRAGIEIGDDELVVRREIGREGRNRVFLNDQPSSLRLLQEVGPALLRIHGQREEMGLADPDLQRAWLDRTGGSAGRELLERVAARFEEWRGWAERLERVTGDERHRLERIDLLSFQERELTEASPVAGEETELRRDRDVLRHREAILRALAAAYSGLVEEDGAATERLARAAHELEAIAAWEPAAEAALGELAELRTRLDEVGRTLGERLAEVETEPGRLDEIESRLAHLERLFRKYGTDSAGLAEGLEEIRAELGQLETDAADRGQLEAKVAAALEAYRRVANELSLARGAWGQELAERLEGELAELALRGVRFEVGLERARRSDSPLRIDGEAVEFGPHGFDRVVFRFAPNPGEPLAPIGRIASGGELARISLALQLAARGDELEGGPTLVFDEADAGLGGAQGAALGRKLKRLARHGQILAVTHLAQVASYGDRHHKVTKQARQGRTFARVAALEGAERVDEVARMLSGAKITPTSRRHAEEMLAGAEGVHA
ncbi:MAG TPA: DNA repair protein RecN [Thermoanaerobaculia bacterium]|nr:DNA repair protein RecN [Thermoanaerobaculia bacterium]